MTVNVRVIGCIDSCKCAAVCGPVYSHETVCRVALLAGRTPLHVAAMSGHEHVITAMADAKPGRVKAKLMLEMRDNEGKTALAHACVPRPAPCWPTRAEHKTRTKC